MTNTPLALLTKTRHEIEHEERRPQNNERKEHNTQHLGSLLLQSYNPTMPGRRPGQVRRPRKGRRSRRLLLVGPRGPRPGDSALPPHHQLGPGACVGG